MINKAFFEIVIWFCWLLPLFAPRKQKLVLCQQRRVNQESLKLLNKLQTSSIQCLHRKNFLLPQKSVNPHQYQKGQVLAILHEMLQQIFPTSSGQPLLLMVGRKVHRKVPCWTSSTASGIPRSTHETASKRKSDTLGSENLRLQVKCILRSMITQESQDYLAITWIIVQVEINPVSVLGISDSQES